MMSDEESTMSQPSAYLMTMPAPVLFGDVRVIERWCADNEKCRPTLLDLGTARAVRRSDKPR